MNITKTRNIIVAAVASLSFASAAVAPSVSHADTKEGTGTAKGCPVYNEDNGKTEYVAVGSKVGLFTCGSDGEWHFGWAINAARAKAAPPKETTKKVVAVGAVPVTTSIA